MAVVRQQRTSKIGPIGVARTNVGDGGLGDTIRSAADGIRQRYYKIAANEAEQRGREQAAEVNLQSITTLDANTMAPQALTAMSGMGNIQKEAFEKAILLRFEGAVTDDIRAKQAELMQRVSEQRNAPKLFEQLFTEYLETTGSNASGYYKQIITDQGASALEDGRSRLKVAQIARIQAEAKAAKAKADAEYIKNARDQGLAGQPFAFESSSNKTKADGAIYTDVGVTDSATETELNKKARLAYINGALDRILNDKAVAPYAQRIQQYFASGGQFYLIKGLPPAVRSAMREIINISGADDPALYQEIASQNNSVFANAQSSGSYVIADAKAEADRTEAERQAYVDESNESTDSFLLEIEQSLVDNDYEIFARSGSIRQIQDAIKYLDNQSSALYALPINTERRKKLINQVDEAKDQLASGLVLRTLELNPDMAADFADAIKSRNLATLVDIMPSLQFNQFYGLLDEQNAGPLSEIAKAWAAGETRDIDRAKTEQTLDLATQERIFSELVASDDMTALSNYITKMRNREGLYSNVPTKYQNTMKSFEEKYRSIINNKNQAQFKTDSETLTNNVTSDNIGESLSALQRSARNLNGDPEVLRQSTQKMMNVAAVDKIYDELTDMFDVSEASSNQLKYMSIYAETGTAPEGLLQDSANLVDLALMRGEKVNGQTVKAERSFIAEKLNDLSGSMIESLNRSENEKSRALFSYNILNGNPIQNPESEDNQIAAQEVMVDVVGLPEFPVDLFTMSVEEVAANPEYAALLALTKQSKVVPSALVAAKDKFLRGGMSSNEITNFMRNVREFVLTDSTNRIGLNDAAVAAFGSDAAKLQVMFTAYNTAPLGDEGNFLARVLERMQNKYDAKTFEELSGTRSRANFLLEAGVPRTMWDEYEPVVDALVEMQGGNAFKTLSKYIENRLHENNNAYDLFTGSSMVSFDIGAFHSNIKAVDLGIQKIVSDFSTEQEPLHYEVESRVSLDDITAAVADDGYIISAPSVSDAMTQLRVRKRVIYGPRADYSPANPMMQLYTVNEFGQVSIIDGSSFNIATDQRILEEIKKSPKYIKADPTKLQTIDELEGDVDAFLAQWGIGVNVIGGGASPLSNAMQVTVDGTENR